MELDWLLSPPLPETMPRQRVLYQRLREAILSGRIAPGTPLPASRSLAVSHLTQKSLLKTGGFSIASGLSEIPDRLYCNPTDFIVHYQRTAERKKSGKNSWVH